MKEEESISNRSKINKEKDNQRNKKDSIFMNIIDVSKNIQRKSLIDRNQFPFEDIKDDNEYHEENDNIDYDKKRIN